MCFCDIWNIIWRVIFFIGHDLMSKLQQNAWNVKSVIYICKRKFPLNPQKKSVFGWFVDPSLLFVQELPWLSGKLFYPSSSAAATARELQWRLILKT
jgi:hypothetical protein